MTAAATNGDLPARWRGDAACVGADIEWFYPPVAAAQREAAYATAARICAGCLVANECLEYALQHNERQGFWGGATPTRRSQIRSERLAAVRSTKASAGIPS